MMQAQKAFVMNRIGDLGFLLGYSFLLFNFGTLDIQAYSIHFSRAHFEWTPGSSHYNVSIYWRHWKICTAPLYTWLPDAMAGPTPVSALIHAATYGNGRYLYGRSDPMFLFAMAPSDVKRNTLDRRDHLQFLLRSSA
jgi:NADH-quinone oxidoreductase subunit L